MTDGRQATAERVRSAQARAQAREARAQRIRVARARWNLEQTDVARLAGINQSTVSKAEHGRGSANVFDAIEQAYARIEQEAKAS